MAIWIQTLSWALIYSIGQGLVVYASLLLVLKLMPGASSGAKYRLSLSALIILLVWFVATWWQRYHFLMLENEELLIFRMPGIIGVGHALPAIEHYGLYQAILAAVQKIAPWLSSFYLIGLALMLVRLSAGMRQLFSLGTSGLSRPGVVLDELLASLKHRIHFSRGVQLFVSAKAQVPMVVGFFKPMILMPAAAMAQLSIEQLETILLHELAHIKRYDHLLNLLHAVIETILFFNPFVWMTSAIARREMEHCCDDLVLHHTREPLFYATALAALATYPGTTPAFTVAASGRPNQLFDRIKRIMEMKKDQFSYSRMVAAILIVSAIASSIAWLAPHTARARKDRPGKVATAPVTPAPKDALQVSNEEKRPEDKNGPDKATALRPAPAQEHTAVPVSETDERKLVYALIGDGLVDQVRGFIVEKMQDKLYINGMQQADDVAAKYLQAIHKDNIRVQVYPFTERLNQHPDASIMQLLFPVSFSSGCVDYGAKKEGC